MAKSSLAQSLCLSYSDYQQFHFFQYQDLYDLYSVDHVNKSAAAHVSLVLPAHSHLLVAKAIRWQTRHAFLLRAIVFTFSTTPVGHISRTGD